MPKNRFSDDIEDKNYKEDFKNHIYIKNGSMMERTKQGIYYFSEIEGVIEGIRLDEDAFPFWCIDLRNEKNGELYSLFLHRRSGAFNGLILQLAGKKGLEAIRNRTTIRIEAYCDYIDGVIASYDKIRVYIDGNTVDWAATKLPPIERRMIGNKLVRDYGKRDAMLYFFIDEICEQLV